MSEQNEILLKRLGVLLRHVQRWSFNAASGIFSCEKMVIPTDELRRLTDADLDTIKQYLKNEIDELPSHLEKYTV